MKTRYIALLLTLALLFALPAWAQSYESEDYEYEYEEDYEYEGDPQIAPEIVLVSNPSTGYHWFFTCDEPEVIEVTEHGFISKQEGLLGAPGIERFRLDGYEMGTASIVFSYARSEQEAPLYTITYQVQVDEDWNVSIFQTSFETN